MILVNLMVDSVNAIWDMVEVTVLKAVVWHVITVEHGLLIPVNLMADIVPVIRVTPVRIVRLLIKNRNRC